MLLNENLNNNEVFSSYFLKCYQALFVESYKLYINVKCTEMRQKLYQIMSLINHFSGEAYVHM